MFKTDNTDYLVFELTKVEHNEIQNKLFFSLKVCPALCYELM